MLNKLKNKKFVFVVGLSLALAFGGSFFAYAIYVQKDKQTDDIAALFADEKFEVNKTEKKPPLSTEKKTEKVPEFVPAPDYKIQLAIAKIYDYALNPEAEAKWLALRLSSRAQREKTQRAKLAEEEARALLEREKYLQKVKAVSEGATLRDDGETLALDNKPATEKVEEILPSKIIVQSYEKKGKSNASRVSLTIDGVRHDGVREGVMIAGHSVTELNDLSECVSLVDTRVSGGLVTKVCF